MICKDRTPIQCQCSLRSLVGFNISEAQAMTLVGAPVIDRRNNDNRDTVVGKINAICFDKDLMYMTLYSYLLSEHHINEEREFQLFMSVSFEVKKFETEEKFPIYFRE